MANISNLPIPDSLPADGLSRWRQFAPFSPVSRERFRQLCKIGRAPQPIRLGIRCTMYSNRELHRWLADPINYRADYK
ncbi:transcriptional regulator [Chitinibacter fontanus]|uniref:Transcriptional regulator n=1 Tax=Chitinibacter fontanus TaxID=1737446 RepID=A0A7D5VC98_9NEIS|nr:transcriptional regulator [Chitinibacter fontanus]QLI82952.1 transcriptional regulator [Chitinibacter fontanus]